MDKHVVFVEFFNLGFRHGANDRAAAGLQPRSDQGPILIPGPSADCSDEFERTAWARGYEFGFRVGASDAELASVETPGAHGMIRAFTHEFLAQFNYFGWLD